MYAQYWNLGSRPFENDCNPAFFFRSRTHQAATLKLRYLLESNKGAGLLVGGTGFGKTYLIRILLRDLLEPFTPVVQVQYPLLNPVELLAYLAAELSGEEVDIERDASATDLILRRLEAALIQHSRAHRHPVIVFDDAHLVTDQTVFQTLQLLLNFRDEAPFTVLVSGQPALLARIARIPELDERLGVKAQLQPFSREETAEYIAYRLRVAGMKSSIFNDAALTEIHELSGGVPRRINRIADLSLLVGYADGLKQVSSREIESVADEIGAVAGV